MSKSSPGMSSPRLGCTFAVVLIGLALITGTDNSSVYGSLRRLHRPHISVTVGTPLHLRTQDGMGAHALKAATDRIMYALAVLLPPEYRGAYANPPDTSPSSLMVRR